MGFVGGKKKCNVNFLQEFAELIQYARETGDAGSVASWFVENREFYTQKIFYNSDADWSGLTAFDVIILRIYAPDKVFVPAAESAYRTKTGDIPDLFNLAEILFKSDYYLISHLPPDLESEKSGFMTNFSVAYNKGLRPCDSQLMNAFVLK